MQETLLPPDFDGVFRFTNSSEEEFKAKWGGIEYTFPPMKTVPMIISGASPEEVQHIRKKFAKEWAQREYEKTPEFHKLNDVRPGETPAMYAPNKLEPYIQKCLDPLPLAQAAMRVVPKQNESVLRKDDEGNNVTKVLQKNESLMKSGSVEVE